MNVRHTFEGIAEYPVTQTVLLRTTNIVYYYRVSLSVIICEIQFKGCGVEYSAIRQEAILSFVLIVSTVPPCLGYNSTTLGLNLF